VSGPRVRAGPPVLRRVPGRRGVAGGLGPERGPERRGGTGHQDAVHRGRHVQASRGEPRSDVVGGGARGKLDEGLAVEVVFWRHRETVDPPERLVQSLRAKSKLDLHAMRTSFANELDRRGVPEGIIGDLMRHKPATVTRRNYVRRDAESLRPFINRIPADIANVAGLLAGEPRGEPQGMSTDEDGRAPMSNTRAI